MIVLNSCSNHGNKPITVTIAGQTPAELIMSGLLIEYAAAEIHAPLVDWKGSITFLGKPADYEAFGEISFKSHKITVTYDDKIWMGYLVPEVYTAPNTGFDEYFTLNFISSVDTLKQQFWSAENGLNSIRELLDVIKGGSDIGNIILSLSFSEPFSEIKVHHSNFFNDDGEAETLYTVLGWILAAFALRAYVNDKNCLVVKSFELLNDVANVYPTRHYGINETYSVSKNYEKATVKCSNYQFPEIDADFSFAGGVKIADQPKLEVRRGKHYVWSKVGSYFVYERQLYQYAEGQKAWRFHKYSPSGEVSEFDQAQYYNAATGVPVAGAYPYAWRRYSKDAPDLSVPFEQAIWLKLHNNGNIIPAAQANKIISYNKDNIMFSENTFLFFSGSVAWTWYFGAVPTWETDWNTDYDGIGDMDAGAVQIDPAIPAYEAGIAVRITIKFNGSYWNMNERAWQTSSYINTIPIPVNTAVPQFTFADFGSMSPPIDPATGKPIPFTDEVQGVWCKMPSEIGTLDIAIGISPTGLPPFLGIPRHILFRNFKIKQFRSIQNANEFDLSRDQKDTVYTNTGQNIKEFDPVTFYLCSKNKNNGRSCLYLNDPQHKVDELTYSAGGGSEKPEWHYIRIITKMLSKAKIYNDIFAIDDMKFSYADRYFNGGSLDLINGTVEGEWVEANTNIEGVL